MADCENKQEYIVIPGGGGSGGTGVPGPPGPQGPQGPPGPVNLPLPATDVSVTNFPYTTAQEVFDALLYEELVVSNFKPDISIYELGRTITSERFSWAYNKLIQLQSIIGPQNTTALVSTDREKIVSFTTPLGTTSQFTLVSDDGTNVTNTITQIQFLNGVYFGDSVPPAALDSAFILTLPKTLQSNNNKSFTSNAANGKYAWFASPVRYGIANFSAGGFSGGFQPPVIVSFTNASGFTEDYYLYQSDNPDIGPVNIITT